MLGLAGQAGHTLTTRAEDADVVIVNTCAFIDRAKQESVDAILEIAELKKSGGLKRLVVTGCLAERYRDELQAQIPGDRCRPRHRRGPGHRGSLESLPLTGVRPSSPLGQTHLGLTPVERLRSCHALSPATASRTSRSAGGPSCRATSTTRIPRAILATPRHFAYVKVAEGLRLHLRVLHHSEAARTLPEPVRRLHRPRGRDARRARRPGADSHQPGHHVLRHRPRGARRPRPPPPPAERGRRPRLDPAALPVSDDHR